MCQAQQTGTQPSVCCSLSAQAENKGQAISGNPSFSESEGMSELLFKMVVIPR